MYISVYIYIHVIVIATKHPCLNINMPVRVNPSCAPVVR